VSPLSCCWRGGRLQLWVHLCPPSNRGRAREDSQVLQGEGERERKVKGKSMIVLGSPVLAPQLLPVTHVRGWWAGRGRSPQPPAAVEMAVLSQQWRGELTNDQRGHGPGRAMNTCPSAFRRNVFLVYGSVQLNNLKCCFQPYF